MNLLWLCSWYPSKFDPFNGDFIQRHARAVALYHHVTVIHVVQSGPAIALDEHLDESREGNLTEIVYYPRFRLWPLPGFVDRIRYNLNFYREYRRLIHRYIAAHGKPDLVHVHVPMKAGVAALWLQRKWQVPFVVSEHANIYLQDAPDAFYKRSRYFQMMVTRIFRQAAGVSNVSKENASRLETCFPFLKVKVIHNVVDTRLFQLPEPMDRGADGLFTFIHVSNFAHAKNIEGLMKVLATLARRRVDWRCVMVGNAESLPGYYEAAEARLEWKGEIGYGEVAAEMKKAHCLVLFSNYENFPCVTIEALATGLPVIATRVGGIPEQISGENGTLVEKGDESALVEAMSEMIDRYARFDRRTISADAVEKYSYQMVGRQFSVWYATVLGNRK